MWLQLAVSNFIGIIQRLHLSRFVHWALYTCISCKVNQEPSPIYRGNGGKRSLALRGFLFFFMYRLCIDVFISLSTFRSLSLSLFRSSFLFLSLSLSLCSFFFFYSFFFVFDGDTSFNIDGDANRAKSGNCKAWLKSFSPSHQCTCTRA